MLRAACHAALALGNRLNQGSRRGSAVAVRLVDLEKLSQTKGKGGKTAMDYLARVLEDDAFDRQRMEDEQAWDPPTSKVARLHALSWRRLDPSHPVPPGALDKATADSIRIALLERLALALDGDAIGAEYALCALLASVDKRKDGRAVGALSLGLFCDAAQVDRIAQTLARVFGEVLWE